MANQLLDMMKQNQKKRRNVLGQEIAQTRPLSETASQFGMRAQPTDAITAGQLGATPKQQEMAASQQAVQSAEQQAQQQPLSDRLVTQERQQQRFELPQSGDTVARARSLIESAAMARQQSIEDLVNLPDAAKRDPQVRALITEFNTTTDESRKAEIANQLRQTSDQNAGLVVQQELGEMYRQPLEVEDLATNYFEDPAELQDIVNTIAQTGVDIPDVSALTFTELEQKVSEYADSITGQIDQALELINDEEAPDQLKQVARQSLRDLGASALIATDRELDAMEEALASADVYNVTVDGQQLEGTLNEILSNPTVSSAASAFLNQLASVGGADVNDRNQKQMALLNEKIAANPQLQFLYQSVYDNAEALESVLEQDIAQAAPLAQVLDENEQIRQQISDRAGQKAADLMGLGLQLDRYDDPLVDIILSSDPDSIRATEGIKKMADQGTITKDELDRIKQLPRGQLADRVTAAANTMENINTMLAYKNAGLWRWGEYLNGALDAAGVPRGISSFIDDVRRNPDRYNESERALVNKMDPDNNGALDLDESLAANLKEAVLSGTDFSSLGKMPKTQQMKNNLSQQANSIIGSQEYRDLNTRFRSSDNVTRIMNDKASLFMYAQRLRKMMESSPPDIRSAARGALGRVESDLRLAQARIDKIRADRAEAKRKRDEEAARIQAEVNRELERYRNESGSGSAVIQYKGKRVAPPPTPQKKPTIDTTGGVLNPFIYDPNRGKK